MGKGRMRKEWVVALVAAVSLGLAGVAEAGSTMFSGGFSFPLSPGAATVTLPQFDDLGGTRMLTQITLDLAGTVQADVTAENDAVIPGTMGLSLTGIIGMTAPGGLSATGAIISVVPGVAVAPTDGVPGSGPDFHNFGTIGGSGTDTSSILAGFGPYLGLGTIGVNVAGSGGFSATGVTNSTVTVANFGGSGTAKITYNWITVPEPATMALLGLGGLAGLRRRRRS